MNFGNGEQISYSASGFVNKMMKKIFNFAECEFQFRLNFKDAGLPQCYISKTENDRGNLFGAIL